MEDDDKFTRITLRIPKEVQAKISGAIEGKATSQNAEIVRRLERSFSTTELSEELIISMGIMAMATKQLAASIDPATLPEEKRKFVELLEQAAVQVISKLPKMKG